MQASTDIWWRIILSIPVKEVLKMRRVNTQLAQLCQFRRDDIFIYIHGHLHASLLLVEAFRLWRCPVCIVSSWVRNKRGGDRAVLFT